MVKGRLVQYLVAAAVSLSAITAGGALTWTTPVIPKFHNNETNLVITDSQISWVASLLSPGYMVGSLVARFISDSLGRRATILGSTIPIMTGTIVLLTTNVVWCLYIVKLLWGTGTGMLGTVSVMYLAEISDKEIRGAMSVANRFMLSFGSFLVITVGSFVSYNNLSYLLLTLPICYFVACCFVPESPFYYLKKGKVKAARSSLTKLSSSKDETIIDEKLSAMKSQVKKEMLNSATAKELFTGRRYRKALVIVIGFKLTQIMAGSNAILQYLGPILQDTKVGIDLSTLMIVFGAVKFSVGVISSLLVDKIGRRPMVFFSYLTSGIFLFIVGIYFLIRPASSRLYNYIPFVGITLSTILATLGHDTLVYIIPAELFPLNVKAIAMTFLHIFSGFLNFIAVKSFQQLKDSAGFTGVFWFYASSSLLGAVFTVFMLPETKGKSLKEIQMHLQGKLYEEDIEHMNEITVNDDNVRELNPLRPLRRKT